MDKVKMINTVGKRKRGKEYEVSSRYASHLVRDKLATMVSKKEEKVKPETKEKKPKAKTITKAI